MESKGAWGNFLTVDNIRGTLGKIRKSCDVIRTALQLTSYNFDVLKIDDFCFECASVEFAIIKEFYRPLFERYNLNMVIINQSLTIYKK